MERPDMRWFSSRLDDAFAYVHAIHGAQGRKSGAPAYLGHLMGVAALVIDDGGTEDHVIAALTHDAAEDAGGQARLDDIGARFGDEVAYIVGVCSDSLSEPKPPWKERKSAYLESLTEAMPHPGVIRVTAADKIWNLSATLADLEAYGPDAWSQFRVGRSQQLWYHESVLDILQQAAPDSALVARLARVLANVGAEG